ncbi:tyrosine-type recombinase/integrase [Glutamicibacter uratoxydans]|uniref:tyrosine-type recombinase/integrase n=1 Tax=Glutamicibacter uratoxydans TaxID=43667 RepID=UPI003D6FBC4C
MSHWEALVDDYLRLRRQLGATLAWNEHLLVQYAAYLTQSGSPTITVENAIAWSRSLSNAGLGNPEARAARRFQVIRGFATYMHAVDPAHQIPPRGIFTHRPLRVTPYIYSDEEIFALLQAAEQLSHGVRSHLYTTLFGLLAATGLRVGEALGLDREHVDLSTGTLLVSSGKSRNPRLVPMHPTVMEALERYTVWRQGYQFRPGGDKAAFFINAAEGRLSYDSALKAFWQVNAAAGIKTHRKHPKMHDLRHTFSVKTLLGWYEQGEDVAAMMPTLSTYLGHSDPANTYWYLSAVPELLAQASKRLATSLTDGQERS